ncbi:hypothetical protein [Nonomuraea dietziae]|uniref:hypothetical protein n=1 Tax=Nonomuraea dietziae TaxID=65515 RepID=UPI0033F07008
MDGHLASPCRLCRTRSAIGHDLDQQKRPRYGVFLFNNGYRYPGADHVDVTFYRAQDGSGPYTRCVHYYPGPGEYYIYTPNDPVEIVRVRWRGEC